ncbi:hypothetical protein [Neobacillus sp. D3-1R]|uniref:hypothetical protein n=1 Tax=Neobacillus sp. D3-1R TaxID=3445778 RepID=UPI003FA17041
MGLPLFFVLTLLFTMIFYFQKKSLTLIQNSLVFLVVNFLTTNYLTIVSLNLNWLKITEDHFLFIAILLYRDVIMPVIILIFINAFFYVITLKNKLFLFILSFIFVQVIEVLCTFFDLITYIEWNYFFSAATHTLFLLIGLGLSKAVIYAGEKGLGS